MKSVTSARVAALIAASTAALAAPVLAPTTAHADGCPDIEVIFARGTDEPAGIGRVGESFAGALRNQVGGRSVSTYAVNYPASFDFLAAAGGANDASGRVQYMIDTCPNTRLVLGGYSQGAAVIDVIAAVPVPAVGFNAPLPPNAPNHVAAIALFGNPSTKLGLPITVSPVWAGRSIDLCNPGDPICSDGESMAAHKNYESSGATQQAAGFVAGLV